ncbi:MAG: hypothetical protein ACHQZR_02250 [Candidatus Limnocylindrales bacterium]
MDRSSDTAARRPTADLDRRLVRRAIVRELRLVEGAIALVASGSTTHVTVGGLAFGAQILPRVAGLARQQLVEVHELWSPWTDTCQVEVSADA